jgi:cytochrome b involved in lipid metabolism
LFVVWFLKMGNTVTVYSRDEVSKHNTDASRWIIIHHKVYNVTDFKDHPAPFDVFSKVSGTDCTSDFNIIHFDSRKAHRMLHKYYIGDAQR